MSTGDAALQRMLDKLEKLPELATQAAPEVAHVVQTEIERQIDAGTDPSGKAWKPTGDGQQPLKTAAKALHVTFLIS